MVRVALRPCDVACQGRIFGEVRVVAGNRIALEIGVRHGVYNDVVERLRRALENEAIALARGQPVGKIDKVGVDEIRTLVDNYLVIRRRVSLNRSYQIGIPVIELISVVIPDRDYRGRRAGGL